MRLVTFEDGAGPRLGLQLGDQLLDLAWAHAYRHGVEHPALASMLDLIEAGAEGLTLARDLAGAPPEEAMIPVDRVELLSPLPVPPQMRDFLCFETHMRQAGQSVARLRAMASPDPEAALAAAEASFPLTIPEVWYRQPIYYKCNRFAVQGTGRDVVWPAYSNVMDYELEIAVVIGRGGKDIPAERAGEHIFGYTIFNDFTARDAQAAEMAGPLGPAKGKDFDGANILGPCIVTPDELADPYALTMTARVNDVVWSQGSTSTMHWTFEQMIAHVSRGETLYPGEVLGSGTVGDGCGLEQMRFLKEGDVVELEIEGLGAIRNRIVRASGEGA
jgi:2-keto-4-pentenoate hydratase/2-oxohepta-3-ene-1,7-dioic acid hydratase in catechol pathway